MLLPVIKISLGLETFGGFNVTMIPTNTCLPTEKKRVFTVLDNQMAVDIHVLQGERPLAKDNYSVAMFQFGRIQSRSRGTNQIEITFTITLEDALMTGEHEELRSRLQAFGLISKATVYRLPGHWQLKLEIGVEDLITGRSNAWSIWGGGESEIFEHPLTKNKLFHRPIPELVVSDATASEMLETARKHSQTDFEIRQRAGKMNDQLLPVFKGFNALCPGPRLEQKEFKNSKQ